MNPTSVPSRVALSTNVVMIVCNMMCPLYCSMTVMMKRKRLHRFDRGGRSTVDSPTPIY